MAPASATALSERPLHRLYVQSSTMQCALNLCRPCCYKLIIYGGRDVVPNQRPESCPRFAARKCTPGPDGDEDEKPNQSLAPVVLKNALFQPSMMCLTVGDGNFSFSLALTKYLENGNQLVATSHEAKDTVLATYPDSGAILDQLVSKNVRVLHELDATNATSLRACGVFDRIVWNFPCVRVADGADGQNNEMEANKALLKRFFIAVLSSGALAPQGEVHVTHKTKSPFGQWGLVDIAQASGFVHLGSVVFDRCLFPGYSNKKVLSKGSFPIWDSETFVFVPFADASLHDSKNASFSLPTLSPPSFSNDTLASHNGGGGCGVFAHWHEADWEKEVAAAALYPVTSAMLCDIRTLLHPRNVEKWDQEKRRRKSRMAHPNGRKQRRGDVSSQKQRHAMTKKRRKNEE